MYWLQLTDIDECASGSAGCEQVCTNTVGSFTCSCNTGFTLSSGTFCTGKSYYLFQILSVVIHFWQIMMNVTQTMEAVNIYATTFMEATPAHVELAIL